MTVTIMATVMTALHLCHHSVSVTIHTSVQTAVRNVLMVNSHLLVAITVSVIQAGPEATVTQNAVATDILRTMNASVMSATEEMCVNWMAVLVLILIVQAMATAIRLFIPVHVLLAGKEMAAIFQIALERLIAMTRVHVTAL
jgi:hypothetical protein